MIRKLVGKGNSIRNLLLSLVLLYARASAASAEIKPTSEDALWATLVNGATHKEDFSRKKILGTKVTLVGWIIPNEFDHDELVSFLLARYPGGCVHVPLPPPENVVHVTMKAGAKRLKSVLLTKKVAVVGVLSGGGRVDASFEMEAESVKDAD